MTDPALARPAYGLWAACAAVKLAIFAVAGRAYGYLSDELYFLDAAAHLALGYVDYPPLIAWTVAGLTTLFGMDLLVLRGFACIVGILVTLIAVDLVRILGGGRTAQGLSAIVVLFAPAFLSVQSILTMNVLDQLWWALGFYLLARYLKDRRAADMRWLGVVFGFALLTKLALPVWGLALATAVLLYARWTLTRPEVWQAVAIMVLIASPFLYWQIANGWPFLEFVAAYNAEAPEAMVIDQPIFGLIATMNPPFLLIWLPGLVYGLLAKDPVHRVLGTAAVLCLTLFLLAGVKFYFATPLFILFTGFGAMLWERWLAGRRRNSAIFLASMAISGVFSIPIAAPVLPPPLLQAAADFIRDGEQGSPGTEPAPMGRYFPHFAEMHSWPELVDRVTVHFDALPEDAKRETGLLAAYYGQAGALNQLDGDRLPTAHSGHVSYHFWNAGADFEQLITVGFDLALLERLYARVEVLEEFSCERCMARENGLLIAQVSAPKQPAEEIRKEIKRFYFF